MIPTISSSSYSNADLEAQVCEAFDLLPGDSVPSELLDTAGASILVSAALSAGQVLRAGRVDPKALKAAMGDLGVGLTTAIVLETLIGGA